MPKFLSERARQLNVGIPDYTEESTVLSVTGRVGIGTTNADVDLLVAGDATVTGILSANNLGIAETAKIGSLTVDSGGAFGGDVSIAGTIIAAEIFGDGSTLSNIVSNEVRPLGQGTDPQFVGFLTTTSGIFTSFAAAEIIAVIPQTGNVAIGGTNPGAYKLNVTGDLASAGVVTASEYWGDQIIGTPTGGFLDGAVGIDTSDYTKDSVNEINFILGKLVPKPPTTINDAAFTVTNMTTASLCSGFTPTNNTGGDLTATAGTVYKRNFNNTVTTNKITEYGPGDAGTVVGYVNAVGVGTTTLSPGSNNGVYDALEITNDKDAFFSSRNPGITSEFYEVYDARILNAVSPDGFNKIYIEQLGLQTQKDFWYEDPSTVASPVVGVSTVTVPTSPTLNYSSGVPHYTQNTTNTFTYVLSVENATGDMYSSSTLCSSGGATTGFSDPGTKEYTDFAGGVNPPVRNFGVGTAVTTLVGQAPRNIHQTVNTDATRFSAWSATTPYGSSNARATITEQVNIMGTTPKTNKIDEDNILISSLGTGSGNAVRVNAGSSGDNPTPVYTSFNAAGTAASYESIVRGAVLRHDQTDYSSGFLPVGPDYSSGRSGAQYFQMEIIRSQVSQFNISVTGSYAGCWICMPDNSAWTSSLSGTNGWADMFDPYRGAGIPTSSEPGCSSGGVMNGTSGTFTCVFGTESSSNDSNNRILIRWRLNSGQSITAMSFAST